MAQQSTVSPATLGAIQPIGASVTHSTEELSWEQAQLSIDLARRYVAVNDLRASDKVRQKTKCQIQQLEMRLSAVKSKMERISDEQRRERQCSIELEDTHDCEGMFEDEGAASSDYALYHQLDDKDSEGACVDQVSADLIASRRQAELSTNRLNWWLQQRA